MYNRIFQPGRISEEECKEGLEKTLRCGAMFGLRLLSQGAGGSFGEWDLRERKDTEGRPCLVVLPALLKLTDANGQIFPFPVVHREEYCFDF